MSSLTTYFPAITANDFYTPSMMKYDGTGYYSKSSVSVSGNLITAMGRIINGTVTGTTADYILVVHGGTTNTRRIVCAVLGDARTNSEESNKLQVFCKTAAGTNICNVFSLQNVNDGFDHTFFFSYNGTTGDLVFKVDGVNADNTGATDRTLTTGTLASGSYTVEIGNTSLFANAEYTGNIGFFGYRDAYLTNWSDFMDPQGNPKDIEDNLGTVWGGTPLFWNAYGDMENNLGSAGAMTRSGSIVVSDDGTTGSSYALSATAVEADIASGKTAWVNGQKVTGTLDTVPLSGFNGIQLDAINPVGAADATFNPHNEGAVLVNNGATLFGGPFSLDSEGYAYPPDSWYTYIGATGLPNYTGLGRMYHYWGRVDVANPVTDSGMRILFNLTAEWTDYWEYKIFYNGTNYSAHLTEIVAGSPILRDSFTLGGITGPRFWEIQLYDYGDYLRGGARIFDINGGAQNEDTLYAYASNRAGKNQTKVYFAGNLSPSEWGVRGARVVDL